MAPDTRAEPERERRREPLSERVAGRAAGGAVDEALETLDRPENRERLRRLVASAELPPDGVSVDVQPTEITERALLPGTLAGVVESRVRAGASAGSPDATSVWGRFGGRIYSTALATLSLEVYYRYGEQE